MIESCTKCDLHTTRKKIVWGEYFSLNEGGGCDVMVIAEAPGIEEDNQGRPMVGTSGVEAKHHLTINGVIKFGVYITNVLKCRLPDNRDPKPHEINSCISHLQSELNTVNPKYIITMGRHSTRIILGRDTDMEMVHGIPFVMGSKIVISTYSPAAGMHDPNLMIMFHADMRMVSSIIKGKRLPFHTKDKYENLNHYQIINSTKELDEFLESDVIAIDTEWARGKPWCVSLSTRAGRAGVVPSSASNKLQRIGERLKEDVTTVIHNALYDLPVLDQMGIRPRRVMDTMVMAYLLQNEPQALKVLAYRHCGMVMNNYNDIVSPYTVSKAMEYLKVAHGNEYPNPSSIMEWVKGEPKVRQPQNIGKKIDRIIQDQINGANPFDRWTNIPYEERKVVEDKYGPMIPGELCDTPNSVWVTYSARDADATIRLYPILWERIMAMELESVFWRDMGMMPLVVDMMRNGIKVDKGKFRELSIYFDTMMMETAKKIEMTIGYPINPISADQCRELLYDRLELHKQMGKVKSKSGVKKSTAIDIIKRMNHPVIDMILDYRGYHKMKTSYADVIPGMVGMDGRVRSTLRITRTATGRLSSSNPNLMAQPVRTEEGRMIKDGYVSEDDWTLVSCDYGQIEMKVAAMDSNDTVMLDIFRKKQDIHTKTASWMFGISEGNINEMKHRYPAKRVGFGVLNLITAKGLQRELVVAGAGNYSASDCDDMIKSWFGIYKSIAAYMKKSAEQAKRYGYVRDIWGRVRYIPNIRSQNKWMALEAERQAGNAPIQMGAQGIIKEAMRNLVPVAWDSTYRKVLRALIQIHDSLDWEIRDDYVDELAALIKLIMESAAPPQFTIPLEVDVKVGKRWGSTHKWNPT